MPVSLFGDAARAGPDIDWSWGSSDELREMLHGDGGREFAASEVSSSLASPLWTEHVVSAAFSAAFSAASCVMLEWMSAKWGPLEGQNRTYP